MVCGGGWRRGSWRGGRDGVGGVLGISPVNANTHGWRPAFSRGTAQTRPHDATSPARPRRKETPTTTECRRHLGRHTLPQPRPSPTRHNDATQTPRPLSDTPAKPRALAVPSTLAGPSTPPASPAGGDAPRRTALPPNARQRRGDAGPRHGGATGGEWRRAQAEERRWGEPKEEHIRRGWRKNREGAPAMACTVTLAGGWGAPPPPPPLPPQRGWSAFGVPAPRAPPPPPPPPFSSSAGARHCHRYPPPRVGVVVIDSSDAGGGAPPRGVPP